MAEHEPTTQRQQFAKSYWDERAKSDAHYAIWGDPKVQNPEQLDLSAFAASGENSAKPLLSFVHPEAVALEIGCGIGRILGPLSRHCARVIGVDIAPSMIEQAREFLGRVPNKTLLVNDGASLAAVADASVDFVYSLLVLIHVDKRSAYRYLREIRRVLRPGGMALLQFQNMLSPKGLALFQGVVDSDYPFEFYTPEELRWLLPSAGLGVCAVRTYDEFAEVTAVAGTVEDWQRGWIEDLAVHGEAREGGFAEGSKDPWGAGRLRGSIQNRGSAWRTVQLVSALLSTGPGGATERALVHSVLPLAAGETAKLELLRRGPEGPLEFAGHPALVTLARRTSGVPRAPGGADRLELHFAVVPSGVPWDGENQARFPGLAGVLPLG